MTPITLKMFAQLAGADEPMEDAVFTGFALDHREVRPGDIFVAIKGERSNGNHFAVDALAAGAAAILSEEQGVGPRVVVDDIVLAIGRFGAALRSRFAGPVIAITGSNGKTTTKEFLAAAISPLGNVLKSPGNRNTEYSSPLIWSECDESTMAVVVELAMRGFGQIHHLADIHRPTIGVVTMIGTAHAEKVGSREGIAKAKAEMLQHLPADGCAILWAEDTFLGFLRSQCICPVKTFGFSPDADCQILGYRAIGLDRSVTLGVVNGDPFELELPTVGRHQALNAAAALTAAHLLGVPLDHATMSIRKTELPPMRMELRGLNGGKILLDTYNASPDSAAAAIRTLAELPCEGRRIAILGEMLELGAFTESGHRLLGRAIAEAPIDLFLAVGPNMEFAVDEALRAGFPSQRLVERSPIETMSLDRARELLMTVHAGDLVLIKGSRALGLERAIPEGVHG